MRKKLKKERKKREGVRKKNVGVEWDIDYLSIKLKIPYPLTYK